MGAIGALASWIVRGCPARDRGVAGKALDTLAKDLGQAYSPDPALDEALRQSFALLHARNLREALLERIVGPDWPVDLLSGFGWKFGTACDQLRGDELVAAVRTFQEDLFGEDFDPTTEEVCRPESVVLRAGQVVVVGCSFPVVDVPRFFAAQLRCDNGETFRAGELMSKLVEAVADDVRDSGHRFFQGLKLVEGVGGPRARIPMYEMCFSSDWVAPGVLPEIGWSRLKDLESWRRQRGADRGGQGECRTNSRS
jgi:hypothetical protein